MRSGRSVNEHNKLRIIRKTTLEIKVGLRYNKKVERKREVEEVKGERGIW